MSDRPLLFAIAPQHRSALYELELSMAAADHFDAVFRQVYRAYRHRRASDPSAAEDLS